MSSKPNDRLRKNGKTGDQPMILASADIKIPDKEVHIKQKEEQAPSTGMCSCNPVCTCVPVSSCPCDMVCSCDSVCSTNTCTCHPFDGCSAHSCTCQPVCSCHTYVVPCSCNINYCSCNRVSYWYPN